jgi:hypothetical protein
MRETYHSTDTLKPNRCPFGVKATMAAHDTQVLIDLLAQYREGAEGTAHSDPEIANKWHDKMHAAYKKLRETAEGRAKIMHLMSDPSPHIRAWAGAHCLQWWPEEARAVLEAIRDSDGPESFDAKWTLKEFEEGNLSFDY